jgi:predicted O-methyltransferase YrrM
MNSVLESILSTATVTDGGSVLTLNHPDFPAFPANVDPAEGAFLQELIAEVRPRTTLEIGMAYGVSTLFICEALEQLQPDARHIVMDPHQRSLWRGIGLQNVERAGFGRFLEFHEDRSELVLPKLVERGTTLDFAFIDGWHTFDQVMVEFYYINRMLRVGGIVAFDDADRLTVNRAVRQALNYPAYEAVPRKAHLAGSRSLMGRARRFVAGVPVARRVLRADLLDRDWDLGISGSCVALRKIAEDDRSSNWYADF